MRERSAIGLIEQDPLKGKPVSSHDLVETKVLERFGAFS